MKNLEIIIQGQSFTVRVDAEKESLYLEAAAEANKSLEDMVNSSSVKSVQKAAIMYAFGMKVNNKILEQEIAQYKNIDSQIDECLSMIDDENK